MKKAIVAVGLISILGFSGISFAGDKEELTLKVQLGQERLARIEAQSIILQRDYEQTKSSFEADKAALQKILDKEKEGKGKDEKKK